MSAMTLPGLLSVRAGSDPDAVFLIVTGPGPGPAARITWDAVRRRAVAIAAWLSAAIRPGDRVLLAYPPGAEFAGAFLGAMSAGVIPVPAPPPLPGPLAARYQQIAADCSPAAVLTCTAWRAAGLFDRHRSPAAAATDVLESLPGGRLPDVAVPASTAWLHYTSGTSGPPKGAVITHEAALAAAEVTARRAGLRPGTRTAARPHWDGTGLAGGVLLPLYARHTAIVASPALARTAVPGTPPAPDPGYVLAETAMMPAAGPPAAGAEIVTADPRALRAGRVVPAPSGIRVPLAGRPAPGTAVAVWREDRAGPCEPGETGQILLRGPAVARGYWTRPDARVIAGGRRWLPTGDAGALLPSGDLAVLGPAAGLVADPDGGRHYPALIERTAAQAAASLGVDARTCTVFGHGGDVILAAEASARADPGAAAGALRDAIGFDHGLAVRVVLAETGQIAAGPGPRPRRDDVRRAWLDGGLRLLEPARGGGPAAGEKTAGTGGNASPAA